MSDPPSDAPPPTPATARAGRAARLAGTLGLGSAAALAFEAWSLPLPWMTGPLLALAAASMAGAGVEAPTPLRHLGQWVIGCALGLYFSPQVSVLLLPLAPVLIAGALWALAIGAIFQGWLWHHLKHEPGAKRQTAWFAAAIGGASEMAVLAERHGAQVDRVAASHSLRVVIVVVTIPFALHAAGVQGLDPAAPATHAVEPWGLVWLAAATAGGIAVLRLLRLPNPQVLGALLVAAVLTSQGIVLSGLPKALTNAAQLFIAAGLAARFTPAFLRAAPRWLGAVAVGTLGMIALSSAAAWAVARAAGLHPVTVLLGMSPGGIAEMCITAKGLQLGVPTVTALHVTRYVAVLLLTAPLYRWWVRR